MDRLAERARAAQPTILNRSGEQAIEKQLNTGGVDPTPVKPVGMSQLHSKPIYPNISDVTKYQELGEMYGRDVMDIEPEVFGSAASAKAFRTGLLASMKPQRKKAVKMAAEPVKATTNQQVVKAATPRKRLVKKEVAPVMMDEVMEEEEEMPEPMAMPMPKARAKKAVAPAPAPAPAKRTNARAQIVRQVMSKYGLSLAEASRFVKEKGLY
jgi:hypothetical protein